MTAFINWIDGYKTYLVSFAGLVFGVLVVAGVVTTDQLNEWANVLGGSIIVFSAAIGTIRSALNKTLAADVQK